jgi:hypothetical protein
MELQFEPFGAIYESISPVCVQLHWTKEQERDLHEDFIVFQDTT